MISITAKNTKAETLLLNEFNGYAVTDVSGLSPAAANVNITNIAAADGSLFNSAMIPQRNIVLTVYILNDVERNRQALYKFFSPKSDITLYFQNTSRKAHISGCVESFEGTFFSNAEVFQISVLCPKPFFIDDTEKTVSCSSGSTTIDYGGEYLTGFTASFDVVASSTDASIVIGAKTLTIAGTGLQAGDKITICTKQGEIKVLKGTTSIINQISIINGFPKLSAGSNTVVLTNLSGTLTYAELYGGL